MNPADLVKNLNAAVNMGGAENTLKNSRSVEFYSSEEFFPVLKKIAPFGKVAVLYLKSSFLNFGKEITYAIKKLGLKPYNYVMPEGVALSFDNIFDVITLPEDVRAIIYFDGELNPLVNYVATLSDTLSVYVARTPFVKGALSPFICFDSGKRSDIFRITCKRLVFINFTALQKSEDDAGKILAYILSRYISVIDGKIRSAAFGETFENASELILSAINYCRTHLDNADLSHLTYWAFMTEIAEFLSFGEILKNSSAFSLTYLLKKTENFDFYLYSASKLFGVYLLYLQNNVGDLLSLPDYNARAKALSEKINGGFTAVAEGLIKQRKALKENAEKINSAVSWLKENLSEIQSVAEDFKKATEKLALSQETDNGEFSFAVKSCGDLPDTFNLMTLIRESGLAELI